MAKDNCPSCNVSFDGGSILETFKKQREEGYKVWEGQSDETIQAFVEEFYSEPYRWNRAINLSEGDKNVWLCPDCQHTWS